MKFFSPVIISLLFTLLFSCGRDDSNSAIEIALAEAENAAGAGNYAEALDLCNSLVSSADTAAMNWRDYCRAAQIYAVAYDHDVSTGESMGSATWCLAKAQNMAPDSVSLFLDDIAPDRLGAFNTVIKTLDGLKADHSDVADHEESDFVAVDSIHTH